MLLKHAVDLLDEGVIVTRNDFVVAYVNPAYLHMFDLHNEKLIGRSLKDLFPDEKKSKQITIQSITEKRELNVERLHCSWRGNEMILKVYTKHFEHEGEMYVITRIFDQTKVAEEEKELVHMIEEMTANVVPIAKGYALLPYSQFCERNKNICFLIEYLNNAVTRISAGWRFSFLA